MLRADLMMAQSCWAVVWGVTGFLGDMGERSRGLG
jgi:hypothetical protein